MNGDDNQENVDPSDIEVTDEEIVNPDLEK
jgi:hypothetical protein